MPKIERRTIIRNSILAASGAIIPDNHPENTVREESAGSIFHVFAFQWKPDTSEAQKDKAAREIAAFQGQIPGLLQTHIGPNISPRGKGYTFGGIMLFKDKASLEAYVQNPAHQALLVWLVPLIDALELDLRA
jgi:antibiotic biosynthesis monooxygenase (ABM) superfamily enzyme